MTTPPVGLSNSPFYLRPHQNWAIEQERYRHNQALYSVGEMVMFVLMWHVEDHLKGYVRRCPRCFNGDDARAAKVYEQSTVNKCPMCYGTTFEGGVRAKIIRPAIITDSDRTDLVTSWVILSVRSSEQASSTRAKPQTPSATQWERRPLKTAPP
jgi:hypothetical protein